jgi:hypothetical protein
VSAPAICRTSGCHHCGPLCGIPEHLPQDGTNAFSRVHDGQIVHEIADGVLVLPGRRPMRVSSGSAHLQTSLEEFARIAQTAVLPPFVRCAKAQPAWHAVRDSAQIPGIIRCRRLGCAAKLPGNGHDLHRLSGSWEWKDSGSPGLVIPTILTRDAGTQTNACS